nr:MAG TPA: Loader and inhibitor of phage G40P [Caudoviricetes sp.]
MKFEEFIVEFSKLIEYYEAQASKSLTMLYFENLAQYSLSDFAGACKKIIRDRTYQKMPKIAEFVEAIEGSIDERAVEAWDEVMSSCAQYGPYRSVSFADEAINRAISHIVGGWDKINNCGLDELVWVKKEFLSAYKAYSGKELERTRLRGISELLGCKSEGVHLIGENKNVSLLEMAAIESGEKSVEQIFQDRETAKLENKSAPKLENKQTPANSEGFTKLLEKARVRSVC